MVCSSLYRLCAPGTDGDLRALCRSIEQDARTILGETDLPPKLEPQDGYLW